VSSSAGASVIIWGVARDVIMMSTVTPAMIMLVLGRRRFGQRIAHALRDRLARTVISAVAYPTGQLRHRGPGGS
jgi:hypothetical protein